MMPDLSVLEVREDVVVRLDRDIKASTTRESDDSRLRNMARWLAEWGLRPDPPTLASVKALGASLKAGGYRAAHVYLAVYKAECQRRGHPVDVLMGRHLQDYKRSCLRGLGGPVRPRPLPLDRLGALPASREEWVEDGPINPRAVILCGSWWLCREIELATARARLVELNLVAKPPTVVWHLPTSKTDPEAIGMARCLKCICEEGSRASCPVHCMWDHLAFVRARFSSLWSPDGPSWDLPLFPTCTGAVVSKQAMEVDSCVFYR